MYQVYEFPHVQSVRGESIDRLLLSKPLGPLRPGGPRSKTKTLQCGASPWKPKPLRPLLARLIIFCNSTNIKGNSKQQHAYQSINKVSHVKKRGLIIVVAAALAAAPPGLLVLVLLRRRTTNIIIVTATITTTIITNRQQHNKQRSSF